MYEFMDRTEACLGQAGFFVSSIILCYWGELLMKSWKNLLEFLKKYWYIGVLIVFIIPLILNLLMSVGNFGVGSNDG